MISVPVMAVRDFMTTKHTVRSPVRRFAVPRHVFLTLARPHPSAAFILTLSPAPRSSSPSPQRRVHPHPHQSAAFILTLTLSLSLSRIRIQPWLTLRPVLLVGKDQEDGVLHIPVSQDAVELMSCLIDAAAVLAVHHENEALCSSVVVAPQRPDLVLPSDVLSVR